VGSVVLAFAADPAIATMIAFWFVTSREYWKILSPRSKAVRACPTGVLRKRRVSSSAALACFCSAALNIAMVSPSLGGWWVMSRRRSVSARRD
jgi:hypothetical protein